MSSSGSTSGSASAGAGASISSSSPPASLWLLPRARPSTSTAPAVRSRPAAPRDSGRAALPRPRAGRAASAFGGPRLTLGKDERGQQNPDSDHDEAVGEV